MGTLFRVFVLACALNAAQGFFITRWWENYQSFQTDYTINEVANLLLGGFGLTKDYLLKDDSGIVVADEVTFWCINRDTNEIIQTFMDDPEIGSKINLEKPVAFVIHGWIDNIERNWMQTLLQTYPQFYDETICGVDWKKLANFEYTISARRFVYEVADVVAEFVTYINNQGVPKDSMTLIGHSLGAQISGMVGMAHNGEIGKIYGLDPAGPLFCFPFLKSKDKRLDKTDAKYVQVIATTNGLLGCASPCAHQTFYPNGGTAPQSGCYFPMVQNGPSPETISCSHSKAVDYFLWSLYPENNLAAKQCSNSYFYNFGLCNWNSEDQMGVHHTSDSGYYYINTKSAPPSGTPTLNTAPKSPYTEEEV